MFAERFGGLCKNVHKSPSAVIKEIGLSNSTVAAWNKGVMPSAEALKKLALYFNTSTDYLLGLAEASDNHFAVSDGKPVLVLTADEYNAVVVVVKALRDIKT